jgi:hypothetical protein
MNTQTFSNTVAKYLNIVASGRIEEGQIVSMCSLLNRDKDAARAIFEALDDKELELSAGQQTKGFDFLKGLWVTPAGKERKNSPYGYREQDILSNATDITLKGFYNASVYGGCDNYLPIYAVNSADGSFEYYYNGKLNIIG